MMTPLAAPPAAAAATSVVDSPTLKQQVNAQRHCARAADVEAVGKARSGYGAGQGPSFFRTS